jgi:hypothetical protein
MVSYRSVTSLDSGRGWDRKGRRKKWKLYRLFIIPLLLLFKDKDREMNPLFCVLFLNIGMVILIGGLWGCLPRQLRATLDVMEYQAPYAQWPF